MSNEFKHTISEQKRLIRGSSEAELEKMLQDAENQLFKGNSELYKGSTRTQYPKGFKYNLKQLRHARARIIQELHLRRIKGEKV